MPAMRSARARRPDRAASRELPCGAARSRLSDAPRALLSAAAPHARGRARARALPAVLVVVLVLAGTAGARSAARAQAAGGSPADVAATFARAWSSGAAGELERLLAPKGVSLRLDASTAHVGVMPRQATASLARLLDRHEATEVSVRRSETLGGQPPRALAELAWNARPRGTRELTQRVIFLGLERTDDRWLVVEIRILP